ncbi:hypothetical protein HHL17_10010 [Chitinophaga sp. G-6-1-13]|uniref:Uncharacterized protein n=1 Tax=Chitinophaga fulva TaxID=2728842 RepID=A0A848GGE5_9BACT|nr:hypothetical protein [Chitinophaga fulva]NML37524.1 hypothetical protein [Chitinophaga fulva]
MKFIIVTFGYLFLNVMGCHKPDCSVYTYPSIRASRVSGPADSLRFNLYYISGSCYVYKGFQERDSASVHIISVLEAKTDCECVGTALQRNVVYAFKTPAPGTYYYKWNNNSDRIDTVIVP